MSVNITCKQAVDYISKKEEGKLSLWGKVKLWKHLATCSLCRRFSVQNKIMIKALKEGEGKAEQRLTHEEKTTIAEQVLNDKP